MSILFEPVTVGNLELKNRFLRSATYYAAWAVSEGEPRPLPAAGAEQIELPDDCR